MLEKQSGERRVPANAVHESALIPIHQENNFIPGIHAVQYVSYMKHLWIYKKNSETAKHKKNHKGSEYEAAAGELYQLLLGKELMPLTKWVTNDNKERLGVISQYIENFYSFKQESVLQEVEKRRTNLPKRIFTHSGLAKVLVAAYVFEENDLHLENIGFIKEKGDLNLGGQVVKIDHDQSLWTLTKKYALFNNKNNYSIAINAEDIRSFPVLHHASPRRWVIDSLKTAALRSLNKNAAFNHEKYTYFLKSILLSPRQIKQIAENSFSTKKGAKRFISHINNRLSCIEQALLKLPEFKDFLLNNREYCFQLARNTFTRQKLEYLFSEIAKPVLPINNPPAANLFSPSVRQSNASKTRKKTRFGVFKVALKKLKSCGRRRKKHQDIIH